MCFKNTLIGPYDGSGRVLDPFAINPDIILQNNILQIVSGKDAVVPYTPLPRPVYSHEPNTGNTWQNISFHSSNESIKITYLF
jgi:hypothetical protein